MEWPDPILKQAIVFMLNYECLQKPGLQLFINCLQILTKFVPCVLCKLFLTFLHVFVLFFVLFIYQKYNFILSVILSSRYNNT